MQCSYEKQNLQLQVLEFHLCHQFPILYLRQLYDVFFLVPPCSVPHEHQPSAHSCQVPLHPLSQGSLEVHPFQGIYHIMFHWLLTWGYLPPCPSRPWSVYHSLSLITLPSQCNVHTYISENVSGNLPSCAVAWFRSYGTLFIAEIWRNSRSALQQNAVSFWRMHTV